MLFNSIGFAIFLPIVFFLYWFATKGNLRFQNILLLVASYFFYASWDYRFLFLLMFSTLLDYFTSIKMYEAKKINRKKFWFWLSICVNVGFLGVFKYYNFFASSFADALSLIGFKASFWTLQVILPVGISFYTFHGLSYVIDVYQNRIKPERNFIDYAVFVGFFPLLVAGPIERAMHLLPQIIKKRNFDYSMAVDGMRQILWGLFKKIVVADNAAIYANDIFHNYNDYSGSTLFLGAVFFAIQIYCDFSGYSDIAIGTAHLFGINLIRNFAFPYFSRDIAEFWRRWHISLTTWFRDYLYIPLGGSKGGIGMKIRNTFIIFLVSGFWHGANWTFLAWGFLNALYFLPLILFNRNRINTNSVAERQLLPTIKELFQMAVTFFLTVIAWVFFRADSIIQAFYFLKRMFTVSFLKISIKDIWAINTGDHIYYMTGALLIFIIVEWLQREKQHALQIDNFNIPQLIRWSIYYLLIFSCFWMNGVQQNFIYFQF